MTDDLQQKAARYDAIRALACGPDDVIDQALAWIGGYTEGEAMTPALFDSAFDAFIQYFQPQ